MPRLRAKTITVTHTDPSVKVSCHESWWKPLRVSTIEAVNTARRGYECPEEEALAPLIPTTRAVARPSRGLAQGEIHPVVARKRPRAFHRRTRALRVVIACREGHGRVMPPLS
jgi:hypothetical protein